MAGRNGTLEKYSQNYWQGVQQFRYRNFLKMSFLQNSAVTPAPDLPPPLAGFSNLFVYNVLRQSLLRSGAAYTFGDLQNCRFASGSMPNNLFLERPSND